ncbi:MAG: PAS domain-containing protein [Burkholderiales bacterium]|nr:PAS domain-containing protein [Anaerolineae bacterium]
MSQQPPSNPPPQEITGMLSRVDRLGSATANLFSRLYRGLDRRSRDQQIAELEQARELGERNQQLRRALHQRDVELERLNGILATIGEGVVMQDLEGRIVLINDAARELLGSTKAFWESDLGRLFDAHSDQMEFDTELAPLGEPVRVQINNMIVGAKLAAVSDSEGHRLGTMIVMRDVTRDTLSERLKDQFITAISHELRTPMAAIKGMSEVILGQEPDRPPSRRSLEIISRNVDILDRMIVELLDVSEMSAGAFDIRQEPVDIEALVWNVVNGMTPEVKRAGLDVTVMLRDLSHLHLIGDANRLRWALGHLLMNAIRYTEANGHIVLAANLNDNNHITIQVVDTGVGISDKDLPHVFERFYRGEARTPSGKLLDPRGLGQGLFVSRTVAEAHEGYLTVHSTTGQGSAFTMVLPMARTIS